MYSRTACSHITIGIFIIFFHLFLIFLSIYIFNIFNANIIVKIFLGIIIIFFIGTRMRALGNIIHECSHSTFVPSRKHNIMLGKIICFIDISDFDAYKRDHFSHHRYLGDPERDEDFKERKKIGIFKDDKLHFFRILLIILSCKNWFLLLKTNKYLMSILYFKHKKTFYYLIYLFLLGLAIGFSNLLLFIILPYISSYQMMKLLSDYLDHGAIYFKEATEERTRNHIFSIAILNWIFFPRADCFHLVHHLYPTIPTNQLAKKHNEIMQKNESYKLRRHNIF
ncbi:fatty acid desaturase family protein [Fluviispira vulneris]|uniref:fatty acid desaturase family protein n=1 Tax=Fluviispira vulneris TaxID=2763012 RepID=UPI0025709152|nr:fatty acid desaturase [Fluviispira vulneris]